ncbi:FAD-dependent oxidoreductase [Neobacillus cucumis]|uniref:oxidoreductase n=1 Tax=Neobacillus cucumis TaxID=1740721 RepID=UPI0018DF16CD|nr:FAD-dependent oxidoreductase [Neobacillus cucumis]MBI0579221.1 FAD-dependent oxidoreductase [Neobacillus cucumis]
MNNTIVNFSQDLFSPFYIGSVKVKNRIMMAPMETNMPSLTGEVNDRVIQYYKERAEGGAGAIIVEFTCVDSPVGKGTEAQLVIDHDGYIPGHTYLTEEIQKYNCRAFLQLHHAGRQTNSKITGFQPVAPSPIACKVMRAEPRELTTEEVADLVTKFVRGAKRAKLAGYDGVELHAAHGYLLGSFLSPYTNKRTDRYGGNTVNRTRMIQEIIQGIKAKVDRNFPVIVRFSADEFVEGGLKIEESIEIAKLLESYGVDAIHVSTGTFESNDKNIDPMSAKQGWRIKLASEIKKHVTVPIIGVGVIREPEFANDIIQSGKVDFIALGRALIADPKWPEKARKKNYKEINRCTTCGYCTDRLRQHQSIRCSVNPRAGRELSLPELQPVINPSKKVHVIGAGATGMYTAVLAAKRGYEVFLYERENQLGGLLDVASAPPGKENWKWFKEYLIYQIKLLPKISVFLNKQIHTEDLVIMENDYVIDASGMVPKQDTQLKNAQIPIVSVVDVLQNYKIENRNVLILGSRGAGLEAANFLADKKNMVVVIARSGKRANGLNIDLINRMDLLNELKEKNVKIMNQTDILVDRNGRFQFYHTESKERIPFDFNPDVVVSARGFDSNPILGDNENIIKIGGSNEPGKILNGIWMAYVEVSKFH